MGDKDFFLEPDDAMTMGDINYMRTSKRTRRTFPKTLKNKDGFAFENEVSSIENGNNLYKNSNNNQNTTVNTVFNPTPSSQSQPGVTGGSAVTQTNPVREFSPEVKPLSQTNFDAPKPAAEKRRPSNDMDMFRNMAKNIRK
ncbi:MAG: hypothetical protein HC775_13655 [Hyellaceae cyanobacterium CSU_1_1]|nr:hypothetical protein [Hyellaceae cyanobacterium CSU_1_1]